MAGDRIKKQFSRRDFVKGSGNAIAGGALSVAAIASMPEHAVAAGPAPVKTDYPKSSKYLVYDSRQCAGCQSCMLACSLVHDGATSPSLSRIQVSRSVLSRYPYDIRMAVCRQCPEPLCVDNCPAGACHVDTANGNLRRIEAEKCIGCKTCIKSCPHNPHRTVWNPETGKATKCDLCLDTPYFSKKGGPDGDQACVTTCPMGALKVVAELPSQIDIGGYDVNLAPPPPPPEKFGFRGAKPKSAVSGKQ